jgi:hypothetical protein
MSVLKNTDFPMRDTVGRNGMDGELWLTAARSVDGVPPD